MFLFICIFMFIYYTTHVIPNLVQFLRALSTETPRGSSRRAARYLSASIGWKCGRRQAAEKRGEGFSIFVGVVSDLGLIPSP